MLVVVAIQKEIRKVNGFPDILGIRAFMTKQMLRMKEMSQMTSSFWIIELSVTPLTTLGATVKGIKDKGSKSCYGRVEVPRGKPSGKENREWNARIWRAINFLNQDLDTKG